jgi:hypothetical protein
MSVHSDVLDSIALLALGVLPENEARDVAEHMRDCAECRAEYAALRVAADTVGYAAELTEAEFGGADCARLKMRVMDAVRATNSPKVVPLPVRDVRLRERSSWLAYGAAAAALIVAVVSSANYAVLRKQVDSDAAAVARANVLASLVGPGAKHFALADGEVVTSDGHVYLAIRGLPAPAPGKVYQAWTQRSGSKTMAPSITFSPDPSGLTVIELPQSAAGLAAVAVSVEPAGGSQAPTSTPTFVRPLT